MFFFILSFIHSLLLVAAAASVFVSAFSNDDKLVHMSKADSQIFGQEITHAQGTDIVNSISFFGFVAALCNSQSLVEKLKNKHTNQTAAKERTKEIKSRKTVCKKSQRPP